LVEQGVQGLAVAQSLSQLWHQLGGNIHTASATLIGERKDESQMFVASRTGRTVGANAGFANLCQGAFDGGPEFFKLLKETLAEV